MRKAMQPFLLGADPEVFLQNPRTRQFISAHGIIKGTKEKPDKVAHGAHQVDGMALEFNIDPANTREEFTKNIIKVKKSLERKVKRIAPHLSLAVVPVAHFTRKHMDETPDDAKILGCEPDWNAYTQALNPAPNASTLMRTCAGHIHVGWTEDADPLEFVHFQDCVTITKALDNSLFLFSHLWDKDTTRRKLYGQRGAFRPKSYGVEYRVLSNAWLKEKSLIDLVFNVTTKLCNDVDLLTNINHYGWRTDWNGRYQLRYFLHAFPEFEPLLSQTDYWPL